MIITLENQFDLIAKLEALIKEHSLSLGRRSQYLSLPMDILHLPQCNNGCEVDITDDLFKITAQCTFSVDQVNYLNSAINNSDNRKAQRLRRDLNSIIESADSENLLDLIHILRIVNRFDGRIQLDKTSANYNIIITVPMN